jgi:membrane-associated phospholipid phosphatase
MKQRNLSFTNLLLAFLLLSGALCAQEPEEQVAHQREQRRPRSNAIEPHAGAWKTWVISSGRDYRVEPPPKRAETREELHQLAYLTRQHDAATKQQIAYWDAGAPSYRWMEMIVARLTAGTPTTAFPHRVYTYLALAMHDATIATWEAKYHYNRRRPSEMDSSLRTAVTVPNSPSYPSEHAATAQAAAAVLAHFLPAEAQAFQTMAEQAGWSRVQAGVQYPSDYEAGLTLGRRVAEQVIAKARMDGSDAVWTGTVPTGPCKWTGTNPGNVTAANWRTLLLNSPDVFRPAPPPPCDSPQVLAETAAVRAFPRTFTTNYKAYYWQTPDGIHLWPFRYISQFAFEDHLEHNAPRVARAYALVAATLFDVFIASQDAKFAYWYLRPHQLDTGITALFPVPNFPSYPSNHSSFSTARAEVLAHLFPTRAQFLRALGKEAGDSRIWAGIHYEMDNEVGVQLGRSVASVFIDRARNDGAQ